MVCIKVLQCTSGNGSDCTGGAVQENRPMRIDICSWNEDDRNMLDTVDIVSFFFLRTWLMIL
jgi:hypothetical protein